MHQGMQTQSKTHRQASPAYAWHASGIYDTSEMVMIACKHDRVARMRTVQKYVSMNGPLCTLRRGMSL